MTIRERVGQAIGIFFGTVVVIAMFCGFIALVGNGVDKFAKASEEHDRCLKQATNGYEIKQCR